MVLTEGKVSSYIDPICVLLPALFVACRSRAALIFASLLTKMTTITVDKAVMLTIKAVARESMDAMYALLVSVEKRMPVFVLMCVLKLPVIFSQTTVCTAKLHTLSHVGTSVQMTVVWLMVVGQLPQFEARML